MEIEIEINREDYSRFNQYVFNKKVTRNKYFIGFILLCILLIGFVEFERAGNDLMLFAIRFIPLLILLAAVIFIMNRIYLYSTRFFPRKSGSILGKKKYTFTEEGFEEIQESSVTKRKWNKGMQVEYSRHALYIFIDSMAAYILPARYFKSQKHFDEFLNFIKEGVETAEE